MTRKEFILRSIDFFWLKGIKPILLLLTICYGVIFISNVFFEQGFERIVVFLIISYVILFSTIQLVAPYFLALDAKILSLFSDTFKDMMRKFVWIVEILFAIFSLVSIYYIWQEDWYVASIVLVLNLFFWVHAYFFDKE